MATAEIRKKPGPKPRKDARRCIVGMKVDRELAGRIKRAARRARKTVSDWMVDAARLALRDQR